MGIFPIWSFQMIVAIFLAFKFRLNKVLVLVAANISLPPMIPFILYLSHYTGRFWMGKHAVTLNFDKGFTLKMASENFLQFFLGGATLATISGLFFGSVTYLLLKFLKTAKTNG